MTEAPKGIKIEEFRNSVWGGGKCLDRYIASGGEYFESD